MNTHSFLHRPKETSNSFNYGKKRAAEYGLTLVELMVGLAVSLLITLIISMVYSNSKNVSGIEDAISRVQENGRFGVEMMENDIRMAGFLGCRGQPNTLTNTLNLSYQYQYANGIYGFHGSGGVWNPALDSSISSLPSPPLANTDVITVWGTDQSGTALLQPMASSTDSPQVGANSVFNYADIILIADCNARAVFQITATDPQSTGVLNHSAGISPTPGNASADLTHIYDVDASVYQVAARTYYVAPSLRKPGTNSLWRYCVPACYGTAQNDEISEGIDNLYILYGVDTDNDGAANLYITADAVNTGNYWANIVSVKLQLLLASIASNVVTSRQSYTFGGVSYTPTDSKLRVPVTTVVTLRNRAP